MKLIANGNRTGAKLNKAPKTQFFCLAHPLAVKDISRMACLISEKYRLPKLLSKNVKLCRVTHVQCSKQQVFSAHDEVPAITNNISARPIKVTVKMEQNPVDEHIFSNHEPCINYIFNFISEL